MICTEGGHTWPGGNKVNPEFGPVNQELNASEFLFRFFSKYCIYPHHIESGIIAEYPLEQKGTRMYIKSITKYGFLVADDVDEEPEHSGESWSKQVWRGFNSSFSLKNEIPKKEKTFWEKLVEGFSGNIAILAPILKSEPVSDKGARTQGEPNNNYALTAGIRYNPLTYWFVTASFYKYFYPELQAPWHPDFTYSFGYDDWHPYTFSLVYGNYGGNRLFPNKDKGEVVTKFWEGKFSLGWKFPSFTFLEDLLKFHSSSGLGHRLNYNVVPSYFDLSSNTYKEYKQSLSLDTKWTIYSYFFANVSLFYYLRDSYQQPWDPDFTYGFGYFDWHAGTFSLQYNNYSGNRFPWKQRAANTGRFGDGSLMLSWSWAF